METATTLSGKFVIFHTNNLRFFPYGKPESWQKDEYGIDGWHFQPVNWFPNSPFMGSLINTRKNLGLLLFSPGYSSFEEALKEAENYELIQTLEDKNENIINQMLGLQ